MLYTHVYCSWDMTCCHMLFVLVKGAREKDNFIHLLYSGGTRKNFVGGHGGGKMRWGSKNLPKMAIFWPFFSFWLEGCKWGQSLWLGGQMPHTTLSAATAPPCWASWICCFLSFDRYLDEILKEVQFSEKNYIFQFKPSLYHVY